MLQMKNNLLDVDISSLTIWRTPSWSCSLMALAMSNWLPSAPPCPGGLLPASILMETWKTTYWIHHFDFLLAKDTFFKACKFIESGNCVLCFFWIGNLFFSWKAYDITDSTI
jgi:hypothetical protein